MASLNPKWVILTKDTPRSTHLGKLCGIYTEYFGENGPCYNTTALELMLHVVFCNSQLSVTTGGRLLKVES